MIANRVSYFLDWHGPSESIDTACSSSSVAIHRAVIALRNRECDIALAGGVSLMFNGDALVNASQLGVFSPDGRCKSFGLGANGYVRGEGIGALLLKPLKQAQKDGDTIHGVIRSSAVAHGGKASSLTAPNSMAQSQLLVKAYQKAGIPAWRIGYIEAHATGTELGDPVEVEGLKVAFEQLSKQNGNLVDSFAREKKHYCGLGSVKTNIGHLEPAAGVAGVLKVLLAMRYKKLPKSLHSERLNPYLHLEESPFYVVRQTQDWKVLRDGNEQEQPRVAGISSFGFGGAYAHIVLEEYTRIDNGQFRVENGKKPYYLIGLSAKSEEALKRKVKELSEWFEDGEETQSLEAISCTLNVGRADFNKRCCIVVGSVTELKQTLEQIKQDQKSDNYFYGDEDNLEEGDQAIYQQVLEGLMEEFQAIDYTQETQYRKKLLALAGLYAKGYTVDLKLLHQGESHRRLFLPSYPFEKKRYWVKEKVSSEDKQKIGIAKYLHPLAHENRSTLDEYKFVSYFNGDEFFFKDHKVRGECVFPAVAYLEMARAAGELAGKTQVTIVADTLWARPFVMNEKDAKGVKVCLYKQNNAVAYKVCSFEAVEEHNEMDGGILHAQGKVFYQNEITDDVENIVPEQVDLDHARQRCVHHAEGKELYQYFSQQGLDYGASFQTVREVWSNDKEAVGKLELANSVTTTHEGFMLHPGLLDGALHCIMGLGLGSSKEKNTSATPVPFAVEQIKIYNEIPFVAYSYVRLNSEVSSDRSVLKYDVSITNEKGVILVELKGVSFRLWKSNLPTVTDSSVTNNSVDLDSIYTIPSWEEASASITSRVQEDYDKNLSFIIEEDFILTEKLLNYYQQAEVVTLHAEVETTTESIENNFMKVFECIKAKAQANSKTLFTVVILLSGKHEHYIYEMFSGLMKTASLEYTHMRGKIIFYPENISDYPEDCIAAIDLELASLGDNHIEILYGDAFKQRYVRQIAEISFDQSKSSLTKLLKKNGVYWITGGLGGLGHIFIEYLAMLGNAVVILSGRSRLDEKIRRQLDDWRTHNISIDYYSCDISQLSEVEKTVNSIKKSYGQLDGIIHAAGVIHDALIAVKSSDQIEEVLAPKIKGAFHIDAMTKTMALDFFVLFSSTSSLIGNVGQSDYAGANAFLNGFAEWRQKLVSKGERHGKTVSINWPYWESGGMSISKSASEYMARHYGMYPMPDKKGLEAFESVANGSDTAVGVWYGEVDKIRDLLFEKQKKNRSADGLKQEDYFERENEPLENGLKEEALGYFKQLFSSVTQYPIEKIRAEEKLEKYELDSLKIIELINELEKVFGSLSRTLFFEYQTIAQIVDYFIKDHNKALKSLLGRSEKIAKVTAKDNSDSLPQLMKNESVQTKNSVRPTIKNKRLNEPEPIAIVGMACRFPDANNVDAFWHNLKQGKNSTKEVPLERWDNSKIYDPELGKWGKSTIRWGSFIDDIDKFDPLFFRVPGNEAELMSPELRLFLQTGWECLEDSGYSLDTIKEKYNNNVAVFAGIMDEYYHLFAYHRMMSRPGPLAGSLSADLANQFSYFCGFTGPSVALNTMSTSLSVGLHYAIQCLRVGDCKMALIGGINLIYHPWKNIMISRGGFTTPDTNVVKSFGKGANGTIVGEGVASFLIKTLEQVEKDNDHIYGVIKGIAVNSAGERNGYIAPNPDNQAAAIKHALSEAKIHPRTITYVEAHATATKLGDPVEVLSLTKGFRQYTQDKQYCAIGCVKSNIGHLEPASGAPGLMKILLQFKHRKLVKSLHSEVLNPDIDFENTPFFVPQELIPWEQPKINLDGQEKTYPLRACFSSISAGGVNAEIVLEEYTPSLSQTKSQVVAESCLFIFSALKQKRLEEYIKVIAKFLKENEDFNAGEPTIQLARLAYTLQVGRQPFKQRLAIIASSKEELLNKLTAYYNKQSNEPAIIEGAALNLDQYEIKAKLGISDSKIQEALSICDLNTLANYWVKGIKLDWNDLYKQGFPRRLPLPTYCFEKRRCWYPEYEPWYPNDGSHPFVGTSKQKDSTKLIDFGSEKDDAAVNDVTQNHPTISHSIKTIEQQLIVNLAELLGLKVEDIDPENNFNDYGFNSILMMQYMQNVQAQLGDWIPLSASSDYPSIRTLAQYLLKEFSNRDIPLPELKAEKVLVKNEVKKVKEEKVYPEELLPINPQGTKSPSFWIHAVTGFAQLYSKLSTSFGKDYPLYAFQARGLDGKKLPHIYLKEMARDYISYLKEIQPKGPYILGGYSSGGLIAYEIAQQLCAQGERVARLIMIDTPAPVPKIMNSILKGTSINMDITIANMFLMSEADDSRLITIEEMNEIPEKSRLVHLVQLIKQRSDLKLSQEELYQRMRGIQMITECMNMEIKNYKPEIFRGDKVICFKATQGLFGKNNQLGANEIKGAKKERITPWKKWIKDKLEIIPCPSNHFDMFEEPTLSIIKKHFVYSLETID